MNLSREDRTPFFEAHAYRSSPEGYVFAEMRATEVNGNDKPVPLVSLRDVTQRREARRERERLIMELEAKNAALEESEGIGSGSIFYFTVPEPDA